jgi:MFS family permease
MVVLRQDVPWPVALPTFALACFGMGLAYSPLALIVLREATPASQGSASSSLSLTDTLGTALGTGVSGAIIAAGIRASGEPVPGLAVAFAVAMGVGLLGFVLTYRLHHRSVTGAVELAVPATPQS